MSWSGSHSCGAPLRCTPGLLSTGCLPPLPGKSDEPLSHEAELSVAKTTSAPSTILPLSPPSRTLMLFLNLMSHLLGCKRRGKVSGRHRVCLCSRPGQQLWRRKSFWMDVSIAGSEGFKAACPCQGTGSCPYLEGHPKQLRDPSEA